MFSCFLAESKSPSFLINIPKFLSEFGGAATRFLKCSKVPSEYRGTVIPAGYKIGLFTGCSALTNVASVFSARITFATIGSVKSTRADAQILFAIVELVSVDVVNFLSDRKSHDETVHCPTDAIGSSSIVSCVTVFSKIPLPLLHFREIFVINKSKGALSVQASKRDSFHSMRV